MIRVESTQGGGGGAWPSKCVKRLRVVAPMVNPTGGAPTRTFVAPRIRSRIQQPEDCCTVALALHNKPLFIWRPLPLIVIYIERESHKLNNKPLRFEHPFLLNGLFFPITLFYKRRNNRPSLNVQRDIWKNNKRYSICILWRPLLYF